MTDIHIRNMRANLVRKIEALAHAHNRSLSCEVEDLLERGLSQTTGAQMGLGTELSQAFSAIESREKTETERSEAPQKEYRVEDFFPPRPEGERGLGTELAALVPEEYWDDDFIQLREAAQRPPPDFR
jgi:plasmid stability protein